MATATIIITAKNAAKAAFDNVGKQAEGVSKKLAKWTGILRNLFVGGIFAKMFADFYKTNSYAKELEASGGRVKAAWRDVAEDVSDGFAELVLWLEPAMKKIADIMQKVVDGIALAAGTAGAFIAGGGKDSMQIARETMAKAEADRDARRAAGGAAGNGSADQAAKEEAKSAYDWHLFYAKKLIKEREDLENEASEMRKRLFDKDLRREDKERERQQKSEERRYQRLVEKMNKGSVSSKEIDAVRVLEQSKKEASYIAGLAKEQIEKATKSNQATDLLKEISDASSETNTLLRKNLYPAEA